MLRWILLTTLLLAAPLAAAPRATKEPDKKDGTGINVEIQGQILENDANDPVRNHPGKIHVVKLPAGKSVQIDMKSTDLDAYLRIEDSNGKQLAQDDDSGGNLDARIKFMVPKEDTYKIYATTFGGGTGNYTLTVKELGGAGKANLAKAIKLDTPTAAKATELAAALDENDAKDEKQQNSPAKQYEVEFSENTLYQIDLMSGDFDAFLRILDKTGTEIAFDDDGGEGLNSRILFVPPSKGSYRVVATALGGGAGNYNLTIAHKAKTTKADPKAVHELGKDGLAIGAQLTVQDAKDTVQANSPCHIHQVKLSSKKTYVVDMISSSMDSFLRIEDGNNNEIASDDDSGGHLNARITLQPTADGTYRIITTCLDGRLAGQSGGYVLLIREQ